MKPKSPFVQPFEALPDTLPIYVLENALLPGGELPLEMRTDVDLALFTHALKTDKLIGMIQPRQNDADHETFEIGCAGRIRQYRERKDGRLNVMLTGVCRYRLIDVSIKDDYRIARVDWSDYAHDYETESVDQAVIDAFKTTLRDYFDRHRMQVDWKVLDDRPIEEVVNNLVLVMNMDLESKQLLLEALTVKERLRLFAELLGQKPDPIITSVSQSPRTN
jgi:Lon protease-like protein